MSDVVLHPASLGIGQPAIGQLIRELRQTLQLTQEKFAAELGVTFPTINRWENGHATPSPLALKQLATRLNQLAKSPDTTLRERSQSMRGKYLLAKERRA